jgi:ankyrin repeat protein
VFQYNESWQTPLILAVKLGHKEITKMLISFGADCNWRDIAGRSPLFYAVQNEDVDLVILLIANFSSAFAIDNYGQSLVPVLRSDSCMEDMLEVERHIKM